MNWSFRMGQVAGIDIKVHVTFFLILLLGAVQWGSQFGAAGAVFGVLLMVLLFTCVVLHELGHSLVAQRFGIPVREIVLLPIGGVAVLGRNMRKPLHELLIAAAGPAVNVVLVILLVAALIGTNPGVFSQNGGLLSLLQAGVDVPSLTTLLQWLLSANIMLVLFNLIPAFPLDGGRMLRAGLALVTGYRRATQIATLIGQFAALILGILGIMSGNLLLVIVAAFIFFGAGQENMEGQARALLETLRVGDAYNKHALTLAIGDRVSKVVDYILTSYQPDFAVLQGNQLLGIVTRNDVLQSLAKDPRDVYVTGIMNREFVRVEANATLDEARQAMTEKEARVVAVYDRDTYLGLVSIEDMSEAMAVIQYLQLQRQGRQPEETTVV